MVGVGVLMLAFVMVGRLASVAAARDSAQAPAGFCRHGVFGMGGGAGGLAHRRDRPPALPRVRCDHDCRNRFGRAGPYIALTLVSYLVVYTLLLISYMVVLTQLALKEADGK